MESVNNKEAVASGTDEKIEVFDGRLLHDKPVPYPVGPVKCTLRGDGSSAGQVINLDENLLSRHIMLLGGIGTGKTNTINQLLNQLLNNLTTEDIVIIFDTKGDFYREFYSPGDVVISNDGTATGPNGPDYWNIYNEIEHDEHMEENIIEIANALFREKSKNKSAVLSKCS